MREFAEKEIGALWPEKMGVQQGDLMHQGEGGQSCVGSRKKEGEKGRGGEGLMARL